MGFKSGDWVGHSITSIPWFARNFVASFERLEKLVTENFGVEFRVHVPVNSARDPDSIGRHASPYHNPSTTVFHRLRHIPWIMRFPRHSPAPNDAIRVMHLHLRLVTPYNALPVIDCPSFMLLRKREAVVNVPFGESGLFALSIMLQAGVMK